jgi:hypothetical protein
LGARDTKSSGSRRGTLTICSDRVLRRNSSCIWVASQPQVFFGAFTASGKSEIFVSAAALQK